MKLFKFTLPISYDPPMPVIVFAIASLTPALLLFAGAAWGGLWIWAALIAVTVLWLAMDRFQRWAPIDEGREFPAGDWLLVVLGVLQLTHIPLAIWALTQQLHGLDWVVGFAAFSTFFGQVGNPAAHELIHRPSRGMRRLGDTVYTALLFGHHSSAHRLVHHVHVGTPLDPNSARRGQGFWRYLPRAWLGSFRAGLAAEQALSARSKARRINPYWAYIGVGLGLIVVMNIAFGPLGAVIYLVLCGHAQSQLLVSDYVQHYGLRREQLDSGRYEPVSVRHSWNAVGWYSSAIMLNAPRHSDHHAHPSRTFANLTIEADAPLLPAPLPAMAVLALCPPLWRQAMDKRIPASPSAGDGAGNGSSRGVVFLTDV